MIESKFSIIDKDSISSIDYSLIHETSEETLRWNIDKTKTFVQYNIKPLFLREAIEYSEIEIKQITQTPAWTGIDIVIPNIKA